MHIFVFRGLFCWPCSSIPNVDSMLFVQFPWPLLAIIEILTKDLHLFSPHNMFRRLAPCSRGGFEMNGKLCNRHQTLYLPPERKSGGKYLQKHNALKNFIPSGVSPTRGSPAISLPLLFSNWLVPLPGLPQCRFLYMSRHPKLLAETN